jgi:hypothetical protein
MYDLNLTADFDAELEYKVTPLLPDGLYSVTVVAYSFNMEKSYILWELLTADNGGYLADGETPIDNFSLNVRTFLPVPGDEVNRTTNGRQTKRQFKINMIKEFSEKTGMDITTKEKIINCLETNEYIGTKFTVLISTKEYNGKYYNEVKKVV